MAPLTKCFTLVTYFNPLETDTDCYKPNAEITITVAFKSMGLLSFYNVFERSL